MMPMEPSVRPVRELRTAGALVRAAVWARWGAAAERTLLSVGFVAQLALATVVARQLWAHHVSLWVAIPLALIGLGGGVLLWAVIAAAMLGWDLEHEGKPTRDQLLARDVAWTLDAWQRVPLHTVPLLPPAWACLLAARLVRATPLQSLGPWWRSPRWMQRLVAPHGKRAASPCIQAVTHAIRTAPTQSAAPAWQGVWTTAWADRSAQELPTFFLRFASPAWWSALDTEGRRWVLRVPNPTVRVAALAAIAASPRALRASDAVASSSDPAGAEAPASSSSPPC